MVATRVASVFLSLGMVATRVASIFLSLGMVATFVGSLFLFPDRENFKWRMPPEAQAHSPFSIK
jgi:hypothetical protein